MLALTSYEAGLCPNGCGGLLHETTDPSIKWDVPPPVRCFKCLTLSQEQRMHQQTHPETGQLIDPHFRTLLWGAQRI
jgi:hypothetical protein